MCAFFVTDVQEKMGKQKLKVKKEEAKELSNIQYVKIILFVQITAALNRVDQRVSGTKAQKLKK